MCKRTFGTVIHFCFLCNAACDLKISIHKLNSPYKTRTKTSIRYAKENDRELRERSRERKVEGEI